MLRLSFPLGLCLVAGLFPASAMAQDSPLDRGVEPAFVAPLSTIGSGDHPPSTTETSPANARSVRRGGRTILLTRDAQKPTASAATLVAEAGRAGG